MLVLATYLSRYLLRRAPNQRLAVVWYGAHAIDMDYMLSCTSPAIYAHGGGGAWRAWEPGSLARGLASFIQLWGLHTSMDTALLLSSRRRRRVEGLRGSRVVVNCRTTGRLAGFSAANEGGGRFQLERFGVWMQAIQRWWVCWIIGATHILRRYLLPRTPGLALQHAVDQSSFTEC